MTIQTDSKALEDPKDPETCNVFALYRIIAPAAEVEVMREKYLAGNYGYGHAKQALYEALLTRFAEERARYAHLMAHPEEIEAALQLGASKARRIASAVLQRVREKVGY
jgi:tryptophanyl-tRNA synthetase